MASYLILDGNAAISPVDLATGMDTVFGCLAARRESTASLIGSEALDVTYDSRDSSLVVNRLTARTASGWRGRWGPQRLALPGQVDRDYSVRLVFSDKEYRPVSPESSVSVWAPQIKLLHPSDPPGEHGVLDVGILSPHAGGVRYIPQPVWSERIDGCPANLRWAEKVAAELSRHETGWLSLATVADRERGAIACAIWLGGILHAADIARQTTASDANLDGLVTHLLTYQRAVHALPQRLFGLGSVGMRSLFEPLVITAVQQSPDQQRPFADFATQTLTALGLVSAALAAALSRAGIAVDSHLPAELFRDGHRLLRVPSGESADLHRRDLLPPRGRPVGLAILIGPTSSATIRAGDVVVRDGGTDGSGTIYLGSPDGPFHWMSSRHWSEHVTVVSGPSAELIDVAFYEKPRVPT